MLLGAEGTSHIFRTVHNPTALVVQANKGLMASHAGPQGCGLFLGDIHSFSALVVETEDRGHTVSAGSGLEGRGRCFTVAYASGLFPCTGGKGGKQKPSRTAPALAVCSSQRGHCPLRCYDPLLLGVPRVEAGFCYKGLLLDTLGCAERPGHIVKIPHLVPLVGGKGDGFSGNKGLHLHIGGCHERTSRLPQINGFLPLIDVERQRRREEFSVTDQARLHHEGSFELGWQFLPPLLRPAQDPQTGCRRQIIFAGHYLLLQNLPQGRSSCVSGRHPSIERRGISTPRRNQCPVWPQQIAMARAKIQK